ncbi:MAG: hypothetical protein WCI84_09580, partial [Bacteroidota bacterium]
MEILPAIISYHRQIFIIPVLHFHTSLFSIRYFSANAQTAATPPIKNRDCLLIFENNGVHLNEKDHTLFTKINKKLIEYENDFSQNIMN